jgi:hypothetical protein
LRSHTHKKNALVFQALYRVASRRPVKQRFLLEPRIMARTKYACIQGDVPEANHDEERARNAATVPNG